MKKEELKNLEELIESIQMSPEQKEAFDKYIANYLNEWKTDFEKKVYEEVTDTVTKEYNEKAKVFEERLRKSLSEEISEELKETIGKEMTEAKDAEVEQQVKEAVDVLNEYYHTRFETFVQETVSEIEKSIREHQEASPEVSAFRQVVNNVAPFIEQSDSNDRMIDVVESQDKLIRELTIKNESLAKEKAIAECLSALPERMRDNMKRFLEESCETVEDVVDKFEHAIEFIKDSEELLEDEDVDGVDDDSIEDDVEEEDETITEDEEADEDDDVVEEDEEEDGFDDEINEKVAKPRKKSRKNYIEDDGFEVDDKVDTLEEDLFNEEGLHSEIPHDESGSEDEGDTASVVRMKDLAGLE